MSAVEVLAIAVILVLGGLAIGGGLLALAALLASDARLYFLGLLAAALAAAVGWVLLDVVLPSLGFDGCVGSCSDTPTPGGKP